MNTQDVLLTIGNGRHRFVFSIATAAYQSLQRLSEWRWPAQERLWHAPALQFTGRGKDEITLEGTILPAFRGGLQQIDELRALANAALEEADQAQPLLLVSGTGEVLGQWAIVSVEERQPIIGPNGAPLEQSFRLTLQRYYEDEEA